MQLTDVRNLLDAKGAFVLKESPDSKFAEFVGALILAITLKDTAAKNPFCFNCGSHVTSVIAHTEQIVWQCNSCTEEGIISHWHGTIWDMTDKTSMNLS